MNKSRSYILPIVLYNYRDGLQKLLNNLENTFIRYNEKEEVLVLTFYKDNLTQKDFDNLINSDIFADFSELEDKFLLVLYIPEEVKDDYYKFIEGKYSQISDSSKEKILKFVHKYYPLDLYSTIGKVLYKDPSLRKEWIEYLNLHEFPEDIELSSKIDLIKETYNG